MGQAFEAADRLGVRWGYELAVEAGTTFSAPIADAVDWLFGQAQQASTVIQTGVTRVVGTVQSLSSTVQSYGQQALDWVTGAAVWTQDWWLRFEEQMSQHLAGVFTAIKVGWTVGLPMFQSYAITASKQVVNLLWGVVWGEPWFPDVPGAGGVSFIGDLLAGIFVVGDIRDVLKYWFVRPFTSDDPWWFNAGMGLLSLAGIFPGLGDIVKVLGKAGLKALVKQTLEEATQKAVREGLDETGQQVAREAAEKALAESLQRIIAALGEDAARKLLQDVSPEVAERLISDAQSLGRLDTLVTLINDGVFSRLLHKGVDPDSFAILIDDLGATGLKTLDGLLQRNMDLKVGLKVAELAQQVGAADTVRQLVSSGNLQNVDSLRKFLKEISDEIANGQYGKLRQLEEAANRSATGPVALERSLNPPGQADVIDIGAREALQLKVVTSTDSGKVVSNITEAARQLRGETGEVPPDLFSKVADIRIESPDNPLATLGREQLLEQLRDWGLDEDILRGVDELRIVNNTGTHLFGLDDFR